MRHEVDLRITQPDEDFNPTDNMCDECHNQLDPDDVLRVTSIIAGEVDNYYTHAGCAPKLCKMIVAENQK